MIREELWKELRDRNIVSVEVEQAEDFVTDEDGVSGSFEVTTRFRCPACGTVGDQLVRRKGEWLCRGCIETRMTDQKPREQGGLHDDRKR